MTDQKLKPLSDGAKGLFAALGMSAAQAQYAIQNPKAKTKAQQLLSLTTKVATDAGPKPASEIVKSATFDLGKYQPRAYVIFIRRSLCKHCKAQSVTHDGGLVFLQYVERKNPSTKLYMPVKTLEHYGLARLRETVLSTSPACSLCFEDVPCVSPETSSPLQALQPLGSSAEGDTRSAPCAEAGQSNSPPACEAQLSNSPPTSPASNDGIPSDSSESSGSQDSSTSTEPSGELSTQAPGCDWSGKEPSDLLVDAYVSSFPTSELLSAHESSKELWT